MLINDPYYRCDYCWFQDRNIWNFKYTDTKFNRDMCSDNCFKRHLQHLKEYSDAFAIDDIEKYLDKNVKMNIKAPSKAKRELFVKWASDYWDEITD